MKVRVLQSFLVKFYYHCMANITAFSSALSVIIGIKPRSFSLAICELIKGTPVNQNTPDFLLDYC